MAKALKELPGIETHLSLSRQCEIADHFADLQMPTLWVDTYTNTASCMMRTMAVPVLAWRMRRYLRAHRIDVVDLDHDPSVDAAGHPVPAGLPPTPDLHRP
ncbi:MAG: hypothetical protein NVV74_04865 [Magnetospirillum sp.]|nr:hypothetical protein [Magnetospirillum sp.]